MNNKRKFLDDLSRSIGSLTARQYGEVVLPDAIPAEHLTRFFSRRFHSAGKGGYGACFCYQAVSIIEFYECRGTKCECAPVVVPGYSKWLRALVQCRGTKPNRRRLLSPVTDVSKNRGGNPGLSPSQLLSKVQRINAKTVTSLLIIPSVLTFRIYF